VRYGLISDVHANLEALTRVLSELERERVDRLVCLGDSVGYHANPNECLSLIRATGATCIAGNHDRAAVRSIEPRHFGRTARHAIHWTRRMLAPEHARFLKSLEVFGILDDRCSLVHAALHPSPNDRYHLSKPERIAASFGVLSSGAIGGRVCFFGHTHRAAVHRFDGQTLSSVAIADVPQKVALDDQYYLINPGSVGQPRDGNARAAFAVYDSADHSIEFHRTEYDVASCLRKAEAAGLLRAPPTLLERATRAVFSFARATSLGLRRPETKGF
jgi:predicted phosphodiesterase